MVTSSLLSIFLRESQKENTSQCIPEGENFSKTLKKELIPEIPYLFDKLLCIQRKNLLMAKNGGKTTEQVSLYILGLQFCHLKGGVVIIEKIELTL